MREQEELELALKSVLEPQPVPQGFALRVMARLENGERPAASGIAPYTIEQAAHFAWIVIPREEKTKQPSLWRRLVLLFYRKGNNTLELGLFAPRNTTFENKTWQPLFSTMAHVLVLAIAVLLMAHPGARILTKAQQQESYAAIEISPLNLPVGQHPLSGGGGGGAHQMSPPISGKPPITQKTPIPVQLLNLQTEPKLAVEPAVALPQMEIPPPAPTDLGVPLGRIVPPSVAPSAGSGSDGGLGTGTGGGLGSGKGTGIGPGEGGGYGGGVFTLGSGVTAPKLIYWIDPEFSEEARRTKFQGICSVALIIDQDGNPTNVHVVRPLGMGLDERAIEAVKQYRFRPAMYKGKPVRFAVTVLVNFRIY